MKRYTEEFINDQIREAEDAEIKDALKFVLRHCRLNSITDFDAIRATVRVIDEYEGRKADEQAEKDFNRHEAEYGADGAAWQRRGGSAW